MASPTEIKLKFPANFGWGTATSSYQIEGGWNVDGKGPSIWDTFCHQNPSPIHDGSTGDIACDSYHRYKEDVNMLKELGVKYYRFSLSWPRLLPNGTPALVNHAGVRYYRNLMAELLENDIQPFVTLFHWDLPQALEDEGGWLSETMVDHFAEYARFCFSQFGDLVKYWLTVNEMWVIAAIAYAIGALAPGHAEAPATYPYIAGHNLVKAHAKAYRVYDNEFRTGQGGKIGPCICFNWGEPGTDSKEDKEAAERFMAFHAGWFFHPICVDGDYPDIMKENIHKKSMAQGRIRSRLPQFTEEEKEMIKGSFDFIGLNYYSSTLVKNVPAWCGRMSYFADSDISTYMHMCWKRLHGMELWLAMTPWGLRKVLQYIKENYGNPEVWITENGCSDDGTTLQDDIRIEYIGKHLTAVHSAIFEDQCTVKGYFCWSLLDNFEWAKGYIAKFGLYSVDFKDPKRTRRAKASAKFYGSVVKSNELVGDFPYKRTRELCVIL